MTKHAKTLIVGSLMVAFWLLCVEPVWAQDSVSVARDLYAAAAYEDALVVLNRLRTSERADDTRTVEQYRAFCLLALGRADEAQHTIEAIVAAEPSYQPSAADVSPRVRSAFTDVRRRMLPAIIQERYAQAKASFDRKEFVSAETGFKQVLDVLSDPDVEGSANQPPLSDIRTLSVGFHELSAAAAAPPPPPPPPPPPVAPVAPPAPRVPRIYSPSDDGIVPPATLQQQLPSYPRDIFPPMRGILELVIDEHGDVESAMMRAPVDDLYDKLVLAGAKNWHYRPAMLDGAPVKFRKLIQISLEPKR